MAHAPIGPALRHIRTLAAGAGPGQLSDGELLRRFVARRDEAAFTALVGRHGPLVWGVCRRLLSDAHDAEDAFQATFLTLARKAASIRKPGAVGPWLYGVAARAAAQARTDRARRAGKAPPVSTSPADPLAELSGRELSALLDEELARLPERCRAPLVLCYLEGRTRDEAAQQLGWSLGTFKRRLEGGRNLLRSRLTRRGLALSAALLATLLPQRAALALPPGLVAATARAVLSAAVSARAAVWAGRVSRGMFLTRLQAGAVLAAVVAVGLGLAWAGPRGREPEEPPQPSAHLAETRPAESPAAEERKDREGFPLPAEALARVGSARLRHGRWAPNLTYSPDGKMLATSGGGLVRLWDAGTGKLLRGITIADGGRITDGLFSADGKTVVTLDGETCRWFDVRTGKEVRRCDVSFPKTNAIACFAPRGEALAVVHMGPGQDLVVYDLPSGKERFRKAAGQRWFSEAAFSADGKTLAVMELEGALFKPRRVMLFDATAGRLLGEFDPGEVFRPVDFSPDGKKLLGLNLNTRTALIWAVPGGELLHRVEVPVNAVVTAAFTPDGSGVLIGTQGLDAVLIDLATGKELRRFRTYPSSFRLAFAPDGKTVAIGTAGNAVTQWELATGRLLPASAEPVAGYMQLQFDEDGKRLWAASDTFLALDWRTGREVRRIQVPHEGTSWVMALSPDRARMSGVNAELKPVVWDAASGRELCVLPTATSGWTMRAFSPDGRTLYTGSWKGPVRAWDAATGKELPAIDKEERVTRSLVVSADGRWLAAADHPQAAGGARAEVTVWDLRAGREAYRLPPRPESGRAWALAFGPDGTLLAAVGGLHPAGQDRDGFVTLWDLRTGKERWSRTGLAATLHCAACSADGRLLVTGGTDGAVRLWELAGGQERHRFTGHESAVHSVAFSPDGKLVAAASTDAPVLIWDVTGTHDKAPATAPFSEDEGGRLWDTLAGTDAAAAFRAMRQLLARPGPAVALLRGHLKPAAAVAAEDVRRLVRDLDDESFATRQKAAEELEKVADQAEPLLRQAREQATSAEAKRQLDRLLESLDRATPERLRGIRAVEVLEQLATPEARKLLEEIARGAKDARPTKEAAASLERLARR
jgi:RNA polymerase sigma factor (sigma-70 family)